MMVSVMTWMIPYLKNQKSMREIVVFLLRPFSWFRFVYDVWAPIARSIGFYHVLSPGDIAIQAGFVLNENRWVSQLQQMAEIVGPNGTVIGIEPDPRNIRKLETLMATNTFPCKLLIVNKATSSKREKGQLLLGKQADWNRLVGLPGSEAWIQPETITDKTVEVDIDTIDHILEELHIAPEKISHVNLTVNGAEYETLKGMTNLLTCSEHLSMTVTAGREQSQYGKQGAGYIDGQPDHVVISHFLSRYNFDVTFKRFKSNEFGYVIGTKGKKRPFM